MTRGISAKYPEGIYYEFFIYPSGLLYVHHNCGISKVKNEAYLGWAAVGSSKKRSLRLINR